MGSQKIGKKGTARSHVPFTQFPLMVTFHITQV